MNSSGVDIPKGLDMTDTLVTQDEVIMEFGSLTVIIKRSTQAIEPNSGDNIPKIQPNSE